MMYSIIIPIYNAEATISRCILSILNQNNRDFELLLINDGSTDSSGYICNSFASKDSRIKVFHKINGGVSSARNLGIEHANGEWIIFIDADDYIEQNYLPNIITNTDLIIYNWKATDNSINDEFIPDQNVNKKNYKLFLKEHLWKSVFRSPWAKIYKRSIIEKENIRFNEKHRIGEDTLFVIEYLTKIKCAKVLCTSTYRYTIYNNNESKYKQDIDVSLKYIKDFWLLYKKLNCKNQKLLKLTYHFFYNITNNITSPQNSKQWTYNLYVIYILHELYYKKGVKNKIIYLNLLFKSFLYNLKLF